MRLAKTDTNVPCILSYVLICRSGCVVVRPVWFMQTEHEITTITK